LDVTIYPIYFVSSSFEKKVKEKWTFKKVKFPKSKRNKRIYIFNFISSFSKLQQPTTVAQPRLPVNSRYLFNLGMGKNSTNTIDSSTIRSMENVLERLNCLNFRGRFDKKEFVHPNGSDQYNKFRVCLMFLIDKIREKDPNIIPLETEEFEDPNLITQKLMLSLRSLDYAIDFPIAKLKQPFGGTACSILDFLSIRALSDFSIGEPKYLDEVNTSSKDEGDWYCTSEEKAIERKDVSEKVQSGTDLIKWRQELERVGPLLEVKFDSKQQKWRAQIDIIVTGGEDFGHAFEASKLVLERLAEDTAATLDSLELNESFIHDKMNHIAEEYDHVSTNTNLLENRSEQSKHSLDDARVELHGLTKGLAEVKAKVEEKGNSITNTSRLLQIKNTLQDIKGEIRLFDFEIGMLEHTLLHKRIQDSRD